MKRDIERIDAEEMTMLQETGMLVVARRRTRGIVNLHMKLDHRISAVGVDCYLQGVRDAAESALKVIE